jgi:hypothetical protein
MTVPSILEMTFDQRRHYAAALQTEKAESGIWQTLQAAVDALYKVHTETGNMAYLDACAKVEDVQESILPELEEAAWHQAGLAIQGRDEP